ncbi:MAG TPA: nucleoside triphosphate pyrophosphohydrolase [Crenotrichaceae bacterium]|nr:nucleoside triphosphate pyrophosphohydrolase [Crenotrichaceae bacterium]
MYSIDHLLDLMAQLRDPEKGCEWDVKQDFHSLCSHTIEEAYEVVDAVQRNHIDDLRDELGDLLLQVIFYSQIAREDGLFDFGTVVSGLADKLIRRHPHVFDDSASFTQQQRTEAWEKVKNAEREAKTTETPSRLDGIAGNLPALIQAAKIQQRAANAGFDWKEVEPVFSKIKEELEEVEDARQTGSQDAIEDEIGDLLFAVVNLARHTNVDAETALRRASIKFTNRFQYIEARLKQTGLEMEAVALSELDRIWDEAKTHGIN